MPRRKTDVINPAIMRPLTPRQRKFSEEIVLGRCSNAEAARRAGYAGHLRDLGDLRDKAVANNQFSAAISAEKHRGQVGGLYVDRKEILHAHINAMSKEDLISRLHQLDNESSGALSSVVDGEFKDVSKA